MRQRLLSLLLTVSMLLSMVATVGATDMSEFSDMPDNFATEALQAAVDNGLLNGSNGQIMPYASLTRAQMAAILVRAFGAEDQADLFGFVDVPSNAWYYEELAAAVEMGLFQGNGDYINPNDAITREQAFVVLARALALTDGDTSTLESYNDVANVSAWASSEVAAMIETGYIQGDLNGNINPKNTFTRQEFAVVMDRMLKTYLSEADTYSDLVTGGMMINAADVVLQDSSVDGILVIGDGVGEGDVTLDSVTVSDTTLIRGGGENSIYAVGDTNLGDVIIAKVSGNVSLKMSDNATAQSITIQTDNVTLTDVPAGVEVIVADDVSGATVNGDAVSAGETVKTTSTTITSSSSGSSGSGGSGSGTGTVEPDANGDMTVTVSGTALNGYTLNTLTVNVGATGSISITDCVIDEVIVHSAGPNSVTIQAGYIGKITIPSTNEDSSRIEVSGDAVVSTVDNAASGTKLETASNSSANVGSITSTDTLTVSNTDVSAISSSGALTLDGSTVQTVTVTGDADITTAGTAQVAEIAVENDAAVTVTGSADSTVSTITGSAGSLTLTDAGATNVTANADRVTVAGACAPVVSGTVSTVEVVADATGETAVTISGSVDNVTTSGSGSVGTIAVEGDAAPEIVVNAPVTTITATNEAAPTVSGTAAVGAVVVDSTNTVTINNTNTQTILATDSGNVSTGAGVDTAVTVITLTLTSIEVTTLPTKLVYGEGEFFSADGAVVTAYYSTSESGSLSKTVTDDAIFDAVGGTVTVTYGGQTTDFTISIVDKVLSAIYVTTVPSKTEYAVGDSVNVSGGVLTLVYTNSTLYPNTTVNMTASMVSEQTITAETTQITVAYEGKTASYAITIVAETPDTNVPGDLVEDAANYLYEIENIDFIVFNLTEGTLADHSFTIDGNTVVPTPVNDEETIVKMAVDPTEQITVTVSKDGDNQDVVITETGSAFTALQVVPDTILTSGSVDFYEYNIDSYDENGNIRTYPTKTTIATTEAEDVHPDGVPVLTYAYKQDATDGIYLYFATDDDANAWANAITGIYKDFGESASSRVSLSYSRNTAENGMSYIKINTTAEYSYFYGRNTEHTILIQAAGYDDIRVTLETVIEHDGVVLVGEHEYITANPLRFIFMGDGVPFPYSWINKIVLDGQLDADGMIVDGIGYELQGDCVDYHDVYYLLTIACHSDAPVLGELTVGDHTLLIDVAGYETIVHDFTLRAPADGESNELEYEWVDRDDAHSDDSSSDDIFNVSAFANVLWDFDLLANAKILAATNQATDISTYLIARWDAMTYKDAIIPDDSNDIWLNYATYKSVVGNANGADPYYSYAEWYADILAEVAENPNHDSVMPDTGITGVYYNRAYTYVNMLEDGCLGSWLYGDDATGQSAPVLTPSKSVYTPDEDIVLSYADNEAWENLVSTVYANGWMYTLRYTLDKEANTITIPAGQFGTGSYEIAVYADGYASATVTVDVYNTFNIEITAVVNDDGHVVVTVADADYMAVLHTLVLSCHAEYPHLLNDNTTGGAGTGDYNIVGNNITLYEGLFVTEEDDYKSTNVTLTLSATGYEDVQFSFTYDLLESGNPTTPVPDYVALYNTTSAGDLAAGTDLLIYVSPMSEQEYRNVITKITVNDIEIEWDDLASWLTITVSSNDLSSGENKIVIYATGYEEAEFTVTVSSSFLQDVPWGVGVTTSAPSYVYTPDTSLELTTQSITSMPTAYLMWKSGYDYSSGYGHTIDTLTINGEVVSVPSNTTYMSLTPYLTLGENTIKIETEGYYITIYTVTVTYNGPETVTINTDASTSWILVGGTREFTATTVPYTVPVTWSVDDAAIATIDADGVLTGLSEGTVVVTATANISDTDVTSTYTLKVWATEPEGEEVPSTVGFRSGTNNNYTYSDSTTTATSTTNLSVYLATATNDTTYLQAVTSITLTLEDGTTSTISKPAGTSNNTLYFTVAPSALQTGTNTITIVADGYQDKVLTITVTATAVPTYVGVRTGTSSNNYQYLSEYEVDNNTTSLAIYVASGTSTTYTAYRNAITSIILTDAEGAETDITSRQATSGTSTTSIYFTVEPSTDMTLGENTITIKANGYEDKTITITVTKATVAVALASSNNYVDNDVALTFSESDYVAGNYIVTVDGTEVTMESTTIPWSYFGAEGTYTIVVTRLDGEKDPTTLTVTITEEPAGEEPPTSGVGLRTNSMSSTLYTEMSLGTNSSVYVCVGGNSAYYQAITSITISNSTYTDQPLTLSYSYDSWDGWYYVTVNKTGSTNAFLASGTNTITIHADGYLDKVLTLTW